MSVSFDAKTAAWTSVNGVTTLSITNLTVGSGSQRALAIMLLCGSQGTTFPTGLTITRDTGESIAAGTIVAVPNTSWADGNLTGTGVIYGLLNPTSGNHTITVSWTGTNEMHACAISFAGVDQTNVATAFPNGATNIKTVSTASPVSVTVTSAVGDVAIAAECQAVSGWGAISGTTIATDSASGPNLAVASNFDTGAATVTLTAAFTGPAVWTAFGTDVKAAGGGGGSNLVGPYMKPLGPRLALGRPRGPLDLGPILPPGPTGTPTLVWANASTLNDNNGITGNAFVFGGLAVTLPGNCLILTIEYPFSSTRTISISDSAGDTWPSAAVTAGTAATSHVNSKTFVLPNASTNLHILTITFDAAIKPFRYTLSEWSGIATSSPVDGTTSSVGSGPNVSAGGFTPTTNNNALGGHLIYSTACSDDTVGTVVASEASAMSATGASLLHADNSATIPSASAYAVQTVNQSVTPGFTITQSTPTNFVCSAVALKVAIAGTPGAAFRLVRLLHISCVSPATGNNTFLFPCDGNLRVATMAAGNNLNQVNSVTDSDGNTYTSRGVAGNSQVFDPGISTTANNAETITLNLNAAEPQFSLHLWDVAGADPTPFLNASGFNGSAPGSGTVFNNFPNHTPSAAPSITIAQTGSGTAAQSAMAAGAPSGSIFDCVSYLAGGSLANPFDPDRMDNADQFGHVVNSTTAAQTWNWTLDSKQFGSTAFATAASYKAAATDVLMPQILM